MAGRSAVSLFSEGDDDEEDGEDDADDGEDDLESGPKDDEEVEVEELFGSSVQPTNVSDGYSPMQADPNDIDSLFQGMMKGDVNPVNLKNLEDALKNEDVQSKIFVQLEKAQGKLLEKSRKLTKDSHLVDALVKTSLKLPVLKKGEKMTLEMEDLQVLKSSFDSFAGKDMGKKLTEKLASIDSSALVGRFVDARLDAAGIGMDRKGVMAFLTISYSKTIASQKELERLREDLAKLEQSVNAATWMDLFDQWIIFFRHVTEMKGAIPLQVVKSIGNSKDTDASKTTLFEYLGAVNAFTHISNIGSPPEGVLISLRKAQGIFKANFNTYILTVDKELGFLHKIQDRKQKLAGLMGTVALSGLITLGGMFTQEEREFVINLVHGQNTSAIHV